MASFYNNYYKYYRPYSNKISRNSFEINNVSSQKEHTYSDSKINRVYPKKNHCAIQSSKNILALNSETATTKEKNSSRYYSFGPINFKNPIFSDIEEPLFEILGIKLYLDDIIILGLLFFLYQEKVQDEMLYIALILLLLS